MTAWQPQTVEGKSLTMYLVLSYRFLGMEHYTLYVKVKASWQKAWRKTKEVHYSGKNPKWSSKNMKHLQSYFYPGPDDESAAKPMFYFQVWESRESSLTNGIDGSGKGDRKICSGAVPVSDILDCQMQSREEEGFEELQVPMERAHEDGVEDSYLVVSFGFHPYRAAELHRHPIGNDMLYINVKSVTELLTDSGLLRSSDVGSFLLLFFLPFFLVTVTILPLSHVPHINATHLLPFHTFRFTSRYGLHG